MLCIYIENTLWLTFFLRESVIVESIKKIEESNQWNLRITSKANLDKGKANLKRWKPFHPPNKKVCLSRLFFYISIRVWIEWYEQQRRKSINIWLEKMIVIYLNVESQGEIICAVNELWTVKPRLLLHRFNILAHSCSILSRNCS